jgi:hypothetical protein
MRMVEEKMVQIKATYDQSVLPDKPNIQMTERVLNQFWDSFY